MTMKMGSIIYKGTLDEMQKEYNNFLEKAKAGYGKMVYEFEDDKLGTFKIQDANIKITFSLSQHFKEYAIYQIFE